MVLQCDHKDLTAIVMSSKIGNYSSCADFSNYSQIYSCIRSVNCGRYYITMPFVWQKLSNVFINQLLKCEMCLVLQSTVFISVVTGFSAICGPGFVGFMGYPASNIQSWKPPSPREILLINPLSACVISI